MNDALRVDDVGFGREKTGKTMNEMKRVSWCLLNNCGAIQFAAPMYGPPEKAKQFYNENFPANGPYMIADVYITEEDYKSARGNYWQT